MPDAGKIFSLLGVVFLLLGLIFNIMPNWPKVPGDIYVSLPQRKESSAYIGRPNLKIYIPFTSAIVISVILTLIFNFFRK